MKVPENITVDRVVQVRSESGLSEQSYLALLGHLLRPPSGEAWLQTVRHWFLVSGLLLLVSGIVYFGAFNWQLLGRLQKLGLLQAILIAFFGGVVLRGLQSIEGRVLLTAASGIVGGLLAVLGQVYQTGADSFLLFLCWALLILPWCLAGRLNTLWVFELALLNTAFTLWWYQRVNDDFVTYSTFFLILNLLLAYIWEQARQKYTWMSDHPAELLLLAGLTPVTLSACAFLIDWKDGGLSFLLLSVTWAVLFKLRGRNLVTMSVVGASLLCLGTTLMGRIFLEGEEVGVLFLGIGVMAEVALLVRWLTGLHKATHQPAKNPSPGTKPSFEVELTPEECGALMETGDLPWYIQALVGFGAWFASLFVWIFFLLVIMGSEGALCFFGALLYGATLYARNKATLPLFLRHATLSIHLAGVMTVAAGIVEVTRDDGPGALAAALLLAVSARFYEEPLGGFLFGFGFVGCGLLAAADSFQEVGSVLWTVALMLLLLFLSKNLIRVLQSTVKTQILPVYRGLTAGLLLTALFLSFDQLHMEFKIALSVLAVGVTVWESHLLKQPNLTKLGLLLVGALANSVPALIVSVFVYLAGFHTRQRLVQGLALASVAASGSFYYYNLELSLMAKSLVLVGSGAVLLALRVLSGLQNRVVDEEAPLAL